MAINMVSFIGFYNIELQGALYIHAYVIRTYVRVCIHASCMEHSCTYVTIRKLHLDADLCVRSVASLFY